MSRRLPPCSVPGGEWRYDGEWWNLYVSGRWSGYTYRLRREGFWTGNAAGLTGGCFAKTYFDAKARREGMAHVEASWRKLHCSPELDPRAAVWCSTGLYENRPHPLIATHGKCWSSWVAPTSCKHESRPR